MYNMYNMFKQVNVKKINIFLCINGRCDRDSSKFVYNLVECLNLTNTCIHKNIQVMKYCILLTIEFKTKIKYNKTITDYNETVWGKHCMLITFV